MSTYTMNLSNTNNGALSESQSTDYYFITNITESKRQAGHYFVLVIGQKSIRLVEHAAPNTNVFELDWSTLSLKINNLSKGTEFNQAFYIKLKRILELPQKNQAVIFRKKRMTISPFKITQENAPAPIEKPTNPIYQLLLAEGFFRTQEDMTASEIISSPSEILPLITQFKAIIDPLRMVAFSNSDF